MAYGRIAGRTQSSSNQKVPNSDKSAAKCSCKYVVAFIVIATAISFGLLSYSGHLSMIIPTHDNVQLSNSPSYFRDSNYAVAQTYNDDGKMNINENYPRQQVNGKDKTNQFLNHKSAEDVKKFMIENARNRWKYQNTRGTTVNRKAPKYQRSISNMPKITPVKRKILGIPQGMLDVNKEKRQVSNDLSKYNADKWAAYGGVPINHGQQRQWHVPNAYPGERLGLPKETVHQNIQAEMPKQYRSDQFVVPNGIIQERIQNKGIPIMAPTEVGSMAKSHGIPIMAPTKVGNMAKSYGIPTEVGNMANPSGIPINAHHKSAAISKTEYDNMENKIKEEQKRQYEAMLNFLRAQAQKDSAKLKALKAMVGNDKSINDAQWRPNTQAQSKVVETSRLVTENVNHEKHQEDKPKPQRPLIGTPKSLSQAADQKNAIKNKNIPNAVHQKKTKKKSNTVFHSWYNRERVEIPPYVYHPKPKKSG